MSGSRKNLNNIDGQLTQIKKGYNNNEKSLGAQIAVLDAVAFQQQENIKIINECKKKVKQHQEAKKRGQRKLVRTNRKTVWEGQEKSF